MPTLSRPMFRYFLSFLLNVKNWLVNLYLMGLDTTGRLSAIFLSQALRKHPYSNVLGILPPKNENFHMKNSCSFHISAQNIDYGYSLELPKRGGSNEYPNSVFLSRNKKNNIYPCKLQFYYMKVGYKGVSII